MRKLEIYVNEKLKVTNNIYVPDLSALLNSKNIREFNSRYEQLSEYLKNDSSDWSIAELDYSKGGPKQLSTKYENTHATFLWVRKDRHIFYGTWDTAYSIRWSGLNNSAKCYDIALYGFKEFLFYDKDLSESGGIYIITENKELMKQINYLMQKAESYL